MAQRVTVDVEFGVRVTKPGLAAISVTAVHADTDELTVSAAGAPRIAELDHGTRAEVYDLPAGEHRVTYHAERTLCRVTAEPVTLADLARYTRPSRFCPADRMNPHSRRAANDPAATAPAANHPAADNPATDDRDRVRAITDHLHRRLTYVPATPEGRDAVATLKAGEGACRDFAHAGIALCRAAGIPARFATVYAPGLKPMDFHAVFEAGVGGRWLVFDATRLAPRQTMLRIATGRDAADTPFLTPLGCELEFLGATVFATTDAPPPRDDHDKPVVLG
ncbi:transglutaminase domain-containing protein [Amycolatopsis rhabdoformis]|uniref:Transglutaminase domain-containing protein n=1 Tax=Amycolatopsis rhabdoformis TaxID=1448059 RepID=A0ABZ1I8Z2_9PSEU|nr:transglutaminase domain-containing protein [Amycolatopsis rhabdoformis]WSE30915.1 transglutaminase domain-containing protein [Amycolatopsis rhabdoformis]